MTPEQLIDILMRALKKTSYFHNDCDGDWYCAACHRSKKRKRHDPGCVVEQAIAAADAWKREQAGVERFTERAADTIAIKRLRDVLGPAIKLLRDTLDDYDFDCDDEKREFMARRDGIIALGKEVLSGTHPANRTVIADSAPKFASEFERPSTPTSAHYESCGNCHQPVCVCAPQEPDGDGLLHDRVGPSSGKLISAKHIECRARNGNTRPGADGRTYACECNLAAGHGGEHRFWGLGVMADRAPKVEHTPNCGQRFDDCTCRADNPGVILDAVGVQHIAPFRECTCQADKAGEP